MNDISRAIAAYLDGRESFNLQDLRFHLMARKFTADEINRAFRHWELSYFDYGERGQGLLTQPGRMKVAELVGDTSASAGAWQR
jgi:hypothetical protein